MQFEQQPLYNAMNFSRSIYSGPNSTVYATGLATLWCPSDGQIAGKRGSAGVYGDNPNLICRIHELRGRGWHVVPRAADLSVTAGSLTRHRGPAVRIWSAIANEINGIYRYNYATTIAGITDGTSNTLLYGERANGLLHLGRFGQLGLVGRRGRIGHAVHDLVPDQSVQENRPDE